MVQGVADVYGVVAWWSIKRLADQEKEETSQKLGDGKFLCQNAE